MMKNYTRALKGLYVLSLLSLLFPWFTYNPSVMGYCWGWQFFSLFLIPMTVIAAYLFRFTGNRFLRILSQVCTLGNLASMVIALGSWQAACNIRGGFHWADGFRTAQPTFWLSAWLQLAFCILFHTSLFLSLRTQKEDDQ